MLLMTEVTPSVPRAIETALSASAWVLTVPFKTTAPLLSVSTLICARLLIFSSASLALTLTVIAESLTNVIGSLRFASASAAWATTGASKVPMTKQAVASLIFMVCPFFNVGESGNDPAIAGTYLFAGAHRARRSAKIPARRHQAAEQAAVIEQASGNQVHHGMFT